jgi:hypothetical protein
MALGTMRKRLRLLSICHMFLEEPFSQKQYMEIGKQIGLLEKEIHQRFQRVLRAGLIAETDQEGLYAFKPERIEKYI